MLARWLAFNVYALSLIAYVYSIWDYYSRRGVMYIVAVRSLSITSWLVIAVFALLTAVYVGVIMLICTLSLVMNIVVLNIYHRSPHAHHMPTWVRIASVA